MARELDAQSNVNREPRKSFNAGGTGPVPVSFPTSGNTGYPTHPNAATGYPPSTYSTGYSNLAPVGAQSAAYGSGNTEHHRKQSGAYTDITRQFNDLGIDGNKEYTTEHERKASGGHTRKYSSNDPTYGAERPRTISGNYVDRANSYTTAAGGYMPTSGPYSNPKNAPNYYASSPNVRSSDISHGSASSGYSGPMYPQAEIVARSTTPFGASHPQVYPRGHVLEGQPVVNNNKPRSRAPSPNPGMKHNFVCAYIFTFSLTQYPYLKEIHLHI